MTSKPSRSNRAPADAAADDAPSSLATLAEEHEALLEAQTEVEFARDRYAELFDLAPFGYLTLGKGSTIKELNATAAGLLGRPRHDLVGLALIRFIAVPDRTKFVRHLRLERERDERITTVLQLTPSDHQAAVWVELSSQRTENGFSRCALLDVTERKRAEDALRDSENRFRSLADCAPALIWMAGPDKKHTYFNQRWLEFTGQPLEKELGDGWIAGVHPDDLKEYLRLYTTAFEDRQEFRAEFRLQRHDGEYRWILDHGIPRFTSTREFLGYTGSCFDITDRKRTETAFQTASRLPYESPWPVVRLQGGRELALANPAAQRILGSRAKWPKTRMAQKIRTLAVNALSKNERRTEDLVFDKRAFQVVFAPVPEAGYVNLYFSDITERLQAEAALREAQGHLEERVKTRTQELTRSNTAFLAEIVKHRRTLRALLESEERLRMMIEATQDYAVFLLTVEGKVNSWNAGAQRLKGYAADEILGQHFSRFYPAEDRRKDIPNQLLKQATAKGRVEVEGWRVRKDKSRFWASIVITALHDSRGKLRGFVKVTRDITDKRQVRQALQKSEERLALFFERSPLALIWVGPNGRVERFNQAWVELVTCPREGCLGRRVSDFFLDKAAATHLLAALARREVVHEHRARLESSDGSLRHVLIDADGLWEKNRLIHSHWFIRDITRRVELEREVLTATEREQRRIGRDLHDDLCQQLTGVEFLSQTLATQLGKHSSNIGGDRAREIARMIRDAISHTRELARGLAPVQLETMGLTGALQELCQRTRKLFRIDCRFRCHKPLLHYDDSLAMHLFRIAQEAVGNAVKHGRAKRIDIGLTRSRDRLILAVKDDGTGIPDRLPKRRGMGLRVMQYRAGVVGATLVVQRNPNGGTAVVCTVKEPNTKAQPEKVV